MAVGVIDRLEPVEVDEEHAQFAAQTTLGNEVFKFFIKRSTVQ